MKTWLDRANPRMPWFSILFMLEYISACCHIKLFPRVELFLYSNKQPILHDWLHQFSFVSSYLCGCLWASPFLNGVSHPSLDQSSSRFGGDCALPRTPDGTERADSLRWSDWSCPTVQVRRSRKKWRPPRSLSKKKINDNVRGNGLEGRRTRTNNCMRHGVMNCINSLIYEMFLS